MFLRKIKYKFDTETLSYVPIKLTFWQRIYNFIVSIIPAFFVSFIFLFILLQTIDSPFEKILQTKTDSLLTKYSLLDKKIEALKLDILIIADNDNNIYRPFFEMDSIPSSIRQAGYGGIEKYKSLKGFENSDLLISFSKKVDILSKQIYIQSVSYDELIKNIKEKDKMMLCIPSVRPVNLKDITAVCTFGMRMHPIINIYRMHQGVDLCAEENTNIYAAGNGIVTAVKFQESLGNYIKINHGYGYETVYGHLNKSLVSIGDSVNRGDLIAKMGTTGISTVVHVHYEIHKNGTPINPMKMFYNDLTDIEYQSLVENHTEAESFFMK